MTTRTAAILTVFALAARAAAIHAARQPVHAPDGGTREFLTSIVIPPIAGAPFSAFVDTEWTKPLADGSTQVLGNHRLIARDGVGRIFQERRTFVSAGSRAEARVTRTELAELATHTVAFCDLLVWICELRRYNPPTSALLDEGPSSVGMLTRESLGTQTVEGLELTGTRETQTIRPDISGTGQPLTVVKEFWYSPRLGVNVLTRRDDPRSGQEVFTVKDIRASEPDPDLFRLPVSFRIVDLRVPVAPPQAR